MDKGQTMKVVFAVAVVLLFLLDYAIMGINKQGGGGTEETPGQYTSYIAVLNATIEYYERTLYVSELDYEMMESIKNMTGVEEVTSDENVYLISVAKKEDVVPIYEKLKQEGIDSYAVAKVTLQPSVTLSDQNETVAYFYNRQTKIGGIEPIFSPGSVIQIKTTVIIQEDQAFQSGTIELYAEAKSINASALVLGKKHYYQFNVPWEQKKEVNLQSLYAEYGEENISYEQKNNIMFAQPLSVEEQISKKFAYVDYISADLAIINENFTDVQQIKQDFGSNIVFANSTLIVIGENVGLNFSSKDYNLYEMKVNISEGYLLREQLSKQNVLYNGSLEEGTTIDITVDSSVSGNNILSINQVEVIG